MTSVTDIQMQILFIHQNFPGQFKLLAEALAQRSEYQVFGLGDTIRLKARKLNFSFSVSGYTARESPKSQAHHYLESFERAIRRGQDVVRACQKMKAQGLKPEIIVGHPAWGELLFIKDVFPDARVISFFEYFYQAEGGDVGFDQEFYKSEDAPFKLRIRNSTQVHALSVCDAGVSPTNWQRSTYPLRDQARIRVLHEGIDTERLKPDPSASFRLPDGRVLTRETQVVTFVSRNLEPYRGFHTFMRALPILQRRLPNAHFVLVGDDGVSYGSLPEQPYKSWREKMMSEVGQHLDMSRTHFTGSIPYAQYVSLLQVSRLHIYFTYPFVLSWSMLEAMACGVPVLGSNTAPVQEVVRDKENGYLFSFFEQADLIEQAVAILSQDQQSVIESARSDVLNNYSFSKNGLPGYLNLLAEVTL